MTTTSEIKRKTMFALVDQWQASGLTRKAFCEEQKINTHTFSYCSYWVTKHRRTDQSFGGFAAVDVSGARPPEAVRITYPNGVVISCPANLTLISQLIHLA